MREPLVRLAGSLWLVMLVGSVLGRAQEEKRSSTAATTPPAITSQDLLNGLKNPSSWLTYSGDYSGQRHSPLKQITPENAHRLSAQWTFQTETTARGRGFEATPLILDGVLYVTGPNNFAWALDARTGRPFWRYRRDLPNNLTYGASAPVNRGFGVLARSAVHDHARRAPRRARHEDGQRRVGHCARRLQGRLLGDDGRRSWSRTR